MDVDRLVEKLRRIEALHAGATTEGERVAAAEARKRIQLRLKLAEEADPPIEYKFTLGDQWSKRVFIALLRRYDIKPYRYRGQRYTTVIAKVSKRFVDETLWPEYVQISDTLRTFLDDVTNKVVAECIHADNSDVAEIEPAALPAPR
ncbi:MAG: hypothetical protein IT381_31140 [Deltaproteobacteria bacterium]|nr:hypothetical protein [Deltaproteobacteria bacterium]